MYFIIISQDGFGDCRALIVVIITILCANIRTDNTNIAKMLKNFVKFVENALLTLKFII